MSIWNTKAGSVPFPKAASHGFHCKVLRCTVVLYIGPRLKFCQAVGQDAAGLCSQDFWASHVIYSININIGPPIRMEERQWTLVNPQCLHWVDGDVCVLYPHTSISQCLHPVCFVQNFQSCVAATLGEKLKLQTSTLHILYKTGCGISRHCQLGKTLANTTNHWCFLTVLNVVLSGGSPGFTWFYCQLDISSTFCCCQDSSLFIWLVIFAVTGKKSPASRWKLAVQCWHETIRKVFGYPH